MRFINKAALLMIVATLSLSLAQRSVAEEEKKAEAKAEEKSEGKGEAKAEGKGEAKAEGKGESRNDGSDREWAKRTTRLNVLEARIKELNKNIGLYIKAKNGGYPMLDEKGNKIDVIPKIAESHKELLKTNEDYLHAKSELKYRFPEEGAFIERKYVPLRVQTIEQIEKEVGINGDLTRTKKLIDKKYETFVGPKPVEAPKQYSPNSTLKKTHAKDGEAPESQRIKLSQ